MFKLRLLAFGFAAMGATSAHGLSLYDGSVAGKPEAQGSLSYFSSALAASPAPAGGHVTLTSADAESVGYSNYTIFSSLVNGSFPSLDPTAPDGFTLSFDVK